MRIRTFQQDLRQWNKEVLDNIFHRKKKLIKELEKISSNMMLHETPH